VQVWTSSLVTLVDADGVSVREERISAATALWAAGVEASRLGRKLGLTVDRQGRIIVTPDLTLPDHPTVFVAGDQASCKDAAGKPLPGVAPVAMQQGQFIARTILGDLTGRPREPFVFRDKGQMATIGRSRAIAEVSRFTFAGFFAWIVWLVVHVYYLTGFRNRVFVVMSWAWSYLTFRRGARLIVQKEWRLRPAGDTAGDARAKPTVT
jgi:NADH dehydrogenase